jgi:hypothetical protein
MLGSALNDRSADGTKVRTSLPADIAASGAAGGLPKRVANASVRRAWLDPDLSVRAGATLVGLSRVNFQKRARSLGLPSKKAGRPLPALPDDFDAMWNAGVSGYDLAALIGRARSCVTRCACLRGLKLRATGAPTITLAAWRVAQVDGRGAGR